MIAIVNELRYRRKFIATSGIWLGFWIIITLLSIAPDTVSSRIASAVGFKSNVSAALFMVSGFLVVISFYLSSRVVKLERQVTELVRKIALNDVEFSSRKEKE